jgi:ribosomal protein S18 acetylase RimI-like enzyme
VRVRGVAWGDFDGVYRLRLGRYGSIARDPNYGMVSYAAPPTPGEFASWFGELHRAILERRSVCSVAVDRGRLVGMCSISSEGRHLETRHVGILGIEVLDGFRGRGVGRALLDHALESCRDRFSEVHLSVIPANVPARRLYERLGFEVYGTAPRAFHRGGTYHDFILMRKRMDGPPPRPRRARIKKGR